MVGVVKCSTGWVGFGLAAVTDSTFSTPISSEERKKEGDNRESAVLWKQICVLNLDVFSVLILSEIARSDRNEKRSRYWNINKQSKHTISTRFSGDFVNCE